MHKFNAILFAWWFLIQGFNTRFDSMVSSTIVGPFPNLATCREVKKISLSNSNGNALATACWSDSVLEYNQEEDKNPKKKAPKNQGLFI